MSRNTRWLRAMIVVLSLVVVGLGLGIRHLGTITRRICRASVQPLDGASSSQNDRFAIRYTAARELFLRSVEGAGGRIESVESPVSGPDGEALFMDFASFGPEDATRILVLGAGTHGVEGFTGSGIQSRLLAKGLASTLPPDVRLLMIHGINPFGMAHWRRFDEDNVDLNRNFRDHSTEPRSNDGYESLVEVIEPESLSFWSEVTSWSTLLRQWAFGKKERVRAAVTGGQYTHPQGLFYGGKEETWSNRVFRSVVGRYVAHTRHVVFVDFHTGLGEYGTAEILLHVTPDSEEFCRAVAIWGPDQTRTTSVPGSVSTHLDSSLKLALPAIAPAGANVTAVTLEFGTFSAIEVFAALRAENWLQHKGGASFPGAAEIKSCLLRAFHPDSGDWERNALEIGERVVGSALDYLGGLEAVRLQPGA
jgi:predicted deacylase